MRSCASCAGDTLKVVFGNPSRAEQAPVRKVLRGEVANRQLREDDLSAALNAEAQLLVDDGPLSVNDGLIRCDVINADFGIRRLAFKLQLKVQDKDLGVLERFGLQSTTANQPMTSRREKMGTNTTHLLLKPCVAKRALESNALDQLALSHTSSGDLFYANEGQVEGLAEALNCVNNHRRKKILCKWEW